MARETVWREIAISNDKAQPTRVGYSREKPWHRESMPLLLLEEAIEKVLAMIPIGGVGEAIVTTGSNVGECWDVSVHFPDNETDDEMDCRLRTDSAKKVKTEREEREELARLLEKYGGRW